VTSERQRPSISLSKNIRLARIRKAMRGCPTPILEPKECIKKAVDEFGNALAVSCSFGACSVVVLHMALQIDPDIKVVFCNTRVEYPETYVYRDLLVEKWNLNLIETKPIKSFWQCVKEYGFPGFRKFWDKDRRSAKPKCCEFLKERPLRMVCKEHDIKAQLNGLRAEESRARMFNFHDRGQYYYAKTQKMWKFSPIAFWSYEQVWEYLLKHNIPVNEVYKTNERSGCMPCTGYQGWKKVLAKTNPKMYRYIQHLMGQSLLDDYPMTLELLEDQLANSCLEVASKTRRQTILEDWF